MLFQQFAEGQQKPANCVPVQGFAHILFSHSPILSCPVPVRVAVAKWPLLHSTGCKEFAPSPRENSSPTLNKTPQAVPCWVAWPEVGRWIWWWKQPPGPTLCIGLIFLSPPPVPPLPPPGIYLLVLLSQRNWLFFAIRHICNTYHQP